MVAENRCRLLLVEDDAETRDLMNRLLSRQFEVTLADCAAAALDAAARCQPHLVITDIDLRGGVDGFALMRELHDRYRIPGIAVTGSVIEDLPAPRSAGFVKWLTKPIRFEDLIQAINETCGLPV